nr:hypothetical protein [Mycobacterium sp. UM_NZ2]
MTTIGYATLQIIPSLRGVTDAIEQQIDGKQISITIEPKVDQRAADKAGEQAGRQAKDSFGKAFGRLGQEDLIKIDPAKARKAGEDAGAQVADGVKKSGQAGAKSAGQIIAEEVGGAIGYRIGEWARNRFPRAMDNLSAARGVLGTQGAQSAIAFGVSFSERIKNAIKVDGFKAVGAKAVDALGNGFVDNLEQNFAPVTEALDNVGVRARNLQGRLGETFVGNAVGAFATGVEKVDGAFHRVQDVLSGVNEVQETVNGAFTAFTSVQQGATAAVGLFSNGTKTATAAQRLWNAALIANPIGIVVAAVAALVGGLVLFFTKTELGRKIWAAFTDLLAAAWEKVKVAFQVAWNVIRTIFDALVSKAGEVWSGIRDRFTAVVDFVKGLPRAITNAAKGMWDGLKLGLVTVLNWISDKWNSFADGLSFHIPGTPIDVKMPKLPKFSGGGYTGNMPIDQIAGVVHGGEHVIKADSRERIENAYPGLLDYLNNNGKLPGYQGGGLVAGAEQLRKIISERFGISNIGGYRPGGDGFDEHVTGRALDVMVGNNSSKGDQVRDFALANADAIDLKWVIWKQHLTYPGGGGYDMEDRGSPTKNHMDHVHIFSGTGIINGLRGSLKPAQADIDAAAPAPDDAAQQAPAGSDVAPAAASSGGASVPTSISGLSSFGLTGLGSGVGTTNSGSDLSFLGDAAGAAVGGQVSSALGVLGVGDSPGWLQGIGKLVSGISVSGADGKKIFGGGSVGGAVAGAGNLFGGSQQSVAPVAAAPAMAPPPVGVDGVHGTASGRKPGPPGATYNIRTATVEDAFVAAQRKEDEANAAKLSRY